MDLYLHPQKLFEFEGKKWSYFLDWSTFSCWNCHLKNTDFEAMVPLGDASKDPCCIIKNAHLCYLYQPWRPGRKKSKLTRPTLQFHSLLFWSVHQMHQRPFRNLENSIIYAVQVAWFSPGLAHFRSKLRKWRGESINAFEFNYSCLALILQLNSKWNDPFKNLWWKRKMPKLRLFL